MEETRAAQADLAARSKFVEGGKQIVETRELIEGIYTEKEPVTAEIIEAATASSGADLAQIMGM